MLSQNSKDINLRGDHSENSRRHEGSSSGDVIKRKSNEEKSLTTNVTLPLMSGPVKVLKSEFFVQKCENSLKQD